MNRYRADQVGSLLRPLSVLNARDALQRNQIDRAALREIEDQAIQETLEMQRSVWNQRSVRWRDSKRKLAHLDG